MTLRLNGSTSGYVEIDAPAVAANNTLTLPSGGELVAATSGNINVTSINSLNYPTAGALSNRNKIINGDMRIDQRNAGASVTVNTGSDFYSVDRFPCSAQGGGVFTAQRSTTAPTGFSNSLLATVTTADASIASTDYYGIQHKVEGFNTADFGSGTANAQAVTLSFWVRSSETGTYGIGFGNNANNRWYPTTYAISAANTWEKKTITLTCDTTGTWDTTNGTGLWIWFDLGSGSQYQGTANSWTGSTRLTVSGAKQLIATNGATFYITGVQLEQGSTATPFERRSYGQELALCQRYLGGIDTRGQAADYHHFGVYTSDGATNGMGNISFAVPMRKRATKIYASAANKFWGYGCTGFTSIIYDQAGINSGSVVLAGGSGGGAAGTAGRFLANATADAYILFEAEL